MKRGKIFQVCERLFVMKQRTVKYVKRNILILVMLCLACMISLCACQTPYIEKCTLQVYADSAMDKKLPLVGDKFLVMDGKGYDIQYLFDTPENLLDKIRTGGNCDLLLTSSKTLLQLLEEDDAVADGYTIELLKSPLAMITSGDHPALPLASENLFYQTEDTAEEIEGYSQYTDVLGELTAEEDWQDEWNEQYAGLWISDIIPSIGILSPTQIEGQCARDILNQDGQIFDLLYPIGKIRFFDSKDDLLDAIRNSTVQIGFCAFTNTFDEKNIQTLKVYDASEPTVSIYVSLLNDSENRKEAKVLLQFLQGNHAKRFFEDFGYYYMR